MRLGRMECGMIIRPEQVNVMASDAELQFETRVCALLRNEFDEELDDVPEEELRDFVREKTMRARTAEVYAEAQIAEFIVISLCLLVESGESEPPWMQDILAQKNLDGGIKVAQIAERAAHEVDHETA
jgi:hypothetical protein